MTTGTMSIGELARTAGLSRSALLYYDRCGLLRPRGRSPAGYRVYGPEQSERLEQIRLYRDMGLSVAEIRGLLDDASGPRAATILRERLTAVGREITRLRQHQRRLFGLLAREEITQEDPMLSKDQFVAVLRAAGMTDEDMRRFHVQFERMEPDAHQEFLESLGIAPDEVSQIRERARNAPA